MSAVIAIVDDDSVTVETLTAYCEDEGYCVHAGRNADDLYKILDTQPVDVILLDIRLPGTDGLTITRDLRSRSDVGIILITSRKDRLDRIVGLEMGADDHVAKPFEPREVVARLRNLLNRLDKDRPDGPDRRIAFGGWTFLVDRRRLQDAQGNDVRLTSAEFEVLHVLATNAGRPLSRDYILSATTRRKTDSNDRTIDSLIARLRRIIEPPAGPPRYIITVHGCGYVFVGDGTRSVSRPGP